MKYSTNLKRAGLLLGTLAVFAYAQAQTFTPGNLVVYRAGDGVGTLINTGNPVFLDEYTIAGSLVQSIPMPTAAAGANLPFLCSGTATSEGLMTLSADAKYLLLTGYGVATSAVSLPGTASATVPRVVGVVSETAVINTSIGLTDYSTGSNPRGVASTNGTDIWVTGGAGGIRYVTSSTTSQQVSATLSNIRGVSIYDGQLYISTSSGSAVRIGAVGTGLPTGTGETISNLPGIPTTGSPYAFVFADMDAGVAGVDVLYVADDTPGTIVKYSLVAGSWVANGTLAAAGIRGLTGFFYSGRAYLYGTTGASAGSGGGTLYSLNDNSGYNAAITGTVNSIVTLPGSSFKAFRGISFAPFTVINVTGTSNQSVNAGAGTATFTVSATGTAPTYQWYENGVPLSDGGIYAGAGTATLTVTNPGSGLNGNTYYCVVTNGTGYFPAGSSDTSMTGTLTVSGCAPTTENNPQAICQGGSYTINGNIYTTAGTYDDTLTSVLGCDSIIITQLTVNPLPVITVSNTGPYCVNGTIMLNATGGGTYSWTGPETFSSTSQSPSIPNATASMSGAYTVVVTDANGCGATDSTLVFVYPLPVATAGSNSPVCENGTIDLTASGGLSYSWAGPNSFTSPSQNPSIPSATLAMSGTYTVIVTDANGCMNANITNVIVQTCVGLQQLSNTAKQIVLAPNPNSGVFTLQSDEELGIIEIYNSLGQLVLKQTGSGRTQEIDMSTQEAGIYTVRVAGRSLKVVKQ